ncbi:MAG: GNAT family N-acetyltransferase [Thermoleophilia bacterium]|nr:GNAT family N-acetyltransferase [Thermoleophilia bacterium]
MRPKLRIARSEPDLRAHYSVRRSIFVREQGIFAETDLDEWDDSALHIVAETDGEIVGAVRIYRLDDFGLWKGDRLAVLPHARGGVGMLLVRFAVESAGLRGGYVMVANVQEANARFFERLGWSVRGPKTDYHGRPHREVSISLRGAVAPDAHAASVAWITG